MQNMFRLPWCTDQVAPKMQVGKAALETMRASPVVDMSVLNKLKRKRTISCEPCLPPRISPVKKQRPNCEAVQQLPTEPARLPTKLGLEHTFTQAPLTVTPDCNQHHQTGAMACEQTDSGVLHRTDSVTARQAAVKTESALLVKDMENDVENVTMADAQLPATDVLGHTPLQQVIENEFNLQILTKHNELRLIEQELAKCQVALEQLRRCELRPYPGAEQLSVAVSNGTGASILPPPSHSLPSHPAPYGVTDGPYTRHYRQWLLHDPQFDSTPVQGPTPVYNGADVAARSTRGSHTARKSVPKIATMPNRSGESMHSLPNYPVSASKDKSAPLVLRRSTDGQLVKLVCNNCQRGNFSSIQGFLNHCRIAHKVDYKSHDAAAVDCGRLLDDIEAASLPAEALAGIAVHKPSGSRSASTTTTPYKSQHLVHPMNLPNGGILPASQQARVDKALKPVPIRSVASGVVAAAHNLPLTPSSQAPRLSAQFAKYQLGGNLEKAVAAATEKVEIFADEGALSPDTLDSASSSILAVGSRTVSGNGRAGSLAPPGGPTRPPSRKGCREPVQRHRPSPLVPTASRHDQGEVPESPQDHSMILSPHNLSPHGVDSEPGLVSDHEDDDHGSASEDDVPQATIAHSLGLRGRGCSDNMEIDVEVDDDMNRHSVIIRRNSVLAGEDRGLRTAGSPSRKLGMGSENV